jgi:hypothetical protein
VTEPSDEADTKPVEGAPPAAPGSELDHEYHVGEKAPPETRYKLRLTVALNGVLEAANQPDNKQPLSLGLIVDSTGERAFGVLMAFLCLPFLLPFTIPGTSAPFGFAIMILGFQVAIRRHKPWLPSRILKWRLPERFTGKLITGVAKFFRPLERFIRPRWLFMQNTPMMMLIGVTLILDGFYLALPWPPFIPLTNTIPAYMALIKILGITEKDGVSLVVGALLTLIATIASIILLILFWQQVVAWSPQWMGLRS